MPQDTRMARMSWIMQLVMQSKKFGNTPKFKKINHELQKCRHQYILYHTWLLTNDLYNYATSLCAVHINYCYCNMLPVNSITPSTVYTNHKARRQYHYLGTKSIFLMKVAMQKFAVFSSSDDTFSLNADTARPTLYLTSHMIISRTAL